MTNPFYKENKKILDELEEKLGIKAYMEIMKVCGKLYRKIEEISEGRDKWRNKFEELLKSQKKK